jgi:uncharacterized membrane protein
MLPPVAHPVRQRVQAIDVVRGLVMVIMALDHCREFWSPTLVRPEDVAQAPALLFFTRWITHFCAPTFVFLSGTSIWLYARRQPGRAQVSRFLLTRGLWLILLEVGLISFVLHWSYDLILLQVIWAIGWGMVLMAGLIWLPRYLLAALALGIIAGHNALPLPTTMTPANAGWALLQGPPFVVPLPGLPSLLVAYSIGPWLGVMLAGYCIGPWFELPLPQRNQYLRWAGTGALGLFGALRATNWYGDPTPWSTPPGSLGRTVLSFLNVSKYPPSLLFVSLTLGAALLLLSNTESLSNRPVRWLRTFGRVPFFYYLGHLLLISGGAWLWTNVAYGQPVNLAFLPSNQWPATYVPNLLRAYLVWSVVVALLYWPCRWYERIKRQRSYWWLSYL